MSRDLTPKELDTLSKQYPELQNFTEKLKYEDGSNVYSEYQIELSHKYPNLGRFGFDFLMICKDLGMLFNEENVQKIQLIEDYFNGIEIDKELVDAINKWYNGEFTPGYYMASNNYDFAEFIKHYKRR